MRTSDTHPLYIDALEVANGRLGLTICPGKTGDSLYGPGWARDLAMDIAAIRAWGPAHVLTLVETDEMVRLGVPHLPDAMRAESFAWHHLPVRDLAALDGAGEAAWARLSPRLHAALERGQRVLVHCRGGVGRAGSIAALLLIERGMGAEAAIARVRAARPNAVETRAQERFLAARAAWGEAPRARAIHAALVGGAMGDSLGADVEFRTLEHIRRRFPGGLADLPPHQGLRGAVTDDTQMTLFTAEGLIRAARQRTDPLAEVHRALWRWHGTQGQDRHGDTASHGDEAPGLAQDPRLNVARAPGMTCLSALSRRCPPGTAASNDSKGCGTIMRVSPVSFAVPREEVRGLALATSALTHGHPTGQWAAVAWAEILADVLAGAGPEEAARAVLASLAAEPGTDETRTALAAALAAPRDGRPETVERLGGGWVAEEALAIALYAVLCARDIAEGLRIAVTHSGDSDSTGAVAGNLLGLVFPEETRVHPWAQTVECADLLAAAACDLASLTAP